MQVIFNEDKTVTMALEDFYRHFTSTVENEPIKTNQKYQVSSGDIEVEVTEFLGQIGMPRNIKGFNFIRQAIIATIQNPRIIDGITKELYPLIAKNNGTTPSRAERAIRHAIEVTWDRGNHDVINSLFGYTVSTKKYKATNSEFIALIADHLRLQIKQGGDAVASDM